MGYDHHLELSLCCVSLQGLDSDRVGDRKGEEGARDRGETKRRGRRLSEDLLSRFCTAPLSILGPCDCSNTEQYKVRNGRRRCGWCEGEKQRGRMERLDQVELCEESRCGRSCGRKKSAGELHHVPQPTLPIHRRHSRTSQQRSNNIGPGASVLGYSGLVSPWGWPVQSVRSRQAPAHDAAAILFAPGVSTRRKRVAGTMDERPPVQSRAKKKWLAAHAGSPGSIDAHYRQSQCALFFFGLEINLDIRQIDNRLSQVGFVAGHPTVFPRLALLFFSSAVLLMSGR